MLLIAIILLEFRLLIVRSPDQRALKPDSSNKYLVEWVLDCTVISAAGIIGVFLLIDNKGLFSGFRRLYFYPFSTLLN